MSEGSEAYREGSLEAPTRHLLAWREPDFYSESALNAELERVFDVCHGCRRCVSLCNAFPTLFDLVDGSATMEVDGVAKEDYRKVVENCYLCDLCFMTKCPYVPPHPWNIDFPHLMLRAKAASYQSEGASVRDRLLSSPDVVGCIASVPVVASMVNHAAANRTVRRVAEKTLGVHAQAPLPNYQERTLRRRIRRRKATPIEPLATPHTKGRVVLFTTCYGDYNEPEIGEDLIAVFEHNGIPVRVLEREACCGMPKLELGDLGSVERLAQRNLPALARSAKEGWDLVAMVPSCVLMFKKEIPLLLPENPDVQRVADAFYDPFEYLSLRHKARLLLTDFKNPLGKVMYHVPCHQRVQNIGPRTRELLSLVPETKVEAIERCSGHNGTYGVKREYHEAAVKIGRPVADRVARADADYFTSDCALAGHHIEAGLNKSVRTLHPLSLLRLAYGI